MVVKKEKGPESAETKSGADAGASQPPPSPPPPPPPVEKPKQVRVIVKGTLGPLLLKEGGVTGDPAYVSILQVKGQKKVVEVK